MSNKTEFDVVICGGGLAGLTLARQLKLELPELSIAVIDRLTRPLPEAAFKVGESSIELGTYYFGQVLQLDHYFRTRHLPNLGLRFFMGDAQDPLTARPEIGQSMFPPVPSYQIELRQALRSVAAIAARLQIHLLVGSPIFSGRRLYNALVVFDRCGRLIHTYAKCQLTDVDRLWFTPGNGLSLFSLDGVPVTAIICHERRYPELVRLPVMAGAQVVFHPNAGMDALAVSRAKRRGRDGIPVRAFENAVYYVFANSVGPQGGGKWSAGDSKIVAPDGSCRRLADNRREQVLVEDLDLSRATRKYALDSLQHPRFLSTHWRRMLPELRQRVRQTDRTFGRWYGASDGSLVAASERHS